MKLWACLMWCVLAAGAAPADPVARLSAAQADLDAAATSLTQRRALGRAISAYEAAMGEVAADLDTVSAEIRAQNRSLVDLRGTQAMRLGALARAGRWVEPMVLVGTHPPIDAVRGLLLLDRLSTDAEAEVFTVQTAQAGLEALRAQQQTALTRLQASRARLKAVRAALIAEARTSGGGDVRPPDISADIALLAGLASPTDAAPAPAALEGLPSPLPQPAVGRLLRGFGALDPAGLSRPGLSIVTEPGALVRVPLRSTLRFSGRLEGYGMVAILELQRDVLLVLGGLGSILADPGEILEAGEILGFLPEPSAVLSADDTEFLRPSTDASGQQPVKTLYIELRHDQQPVDPAAWFQYDR